MVLPLQDLEMKLTMISEHLVPGRTGSSQLHAASVQMLCTAAPKVTIATFCSRFVNAQCNAKVASCLVEIDQYAVTM